jgi:hypothetical protein
LALNKQKLLQEIDEAIANIHYTSPYQNDIPIMVSGMERVRSIVEDAFDNMGTCADCHYGERPAFCGRSAGQMLLYSHWNL